MDTTKEALEYTANLAITAQDKRIITTHTIVGDRTFTINGAGDVKEFRPFDGARDSIQVHTLDALIEYILHVQERHDFPLIVHIDNEDTVSVKGLLDGGGHRETLLVATAIHPKFPFARYLDQEEFNIALQSQFHDNDDRALLLRFVGNLKQEASKTSVDDGVTQTATMKTGVASVESVIVPNPVFLEPWRSFPEVVPAASDFVFRVADGPRAALFEADGGAWRNQQIKNIADYLVKGLEDVLDRVTILS